MGKGPSVSQERAEIGRHSSGGRPASPLSEGRHQGMGRGQGRTRGAGDSRVGSWQVSRVTWQRRHGRHPWQGAQHPPLRGRNSRYVGHCRTC